jgi:hypothetical protein
MFYPDISRRPAYSTKANGDSFASYDRYREEISEDCNHRCTYCDITLEEMGFEGMQLDHFKPQELFPEHKSDPTNLVLSCPKCNRLKSDHWPSAESGLSFIDPFEIGRTNHFSITESGEISATNTQAACYQIELLFLNREARIQIRRRRMVQDKVKRAQQDIESRLQALIKDTVPLEQKEMFRELESIREVLGLFKDHS